jgi:hypothetical protein
MRRGLSPLWLPLAALAGGAVSWAVLHAVGARGDQHGAVPSATVPPQHYSLAEARALSRTSGLPILLLVTPPQATCPPAEMLATTVFAREGLARIAQCAVPARMVLDVRSPSPEAKEFASRHAEFVLPCVFVLSADDEVLHRQEGRLYPPYDVKGCPLEGDWGPLLTVEDLCDLVDRAVGRQQRDDRFLALQSDEAAVLVRQAGILLRRERSEEARTVARRAAAAPLDVTSGPALARLLTHLGEDELAAHVLRFLWSAPGDPGNRRRWALALRRIEEPKRRGASGPVQPPDLVTLQREAAADQDLALEGMVRVEQARRDLDRGVRWSAEEHMAWFVAHPEALAGTDSETAETLGRLAGLAQALERTDLALRWAEELMRRFPDRSDVQAWKHGLFDQLRHSRG